MQISLKELRREIPKPVSVAIWVPDDIKKRLCSMALDQGLTLPELLVKFMNQGVKASE